MICIKIKGGLGNQMFQYATARIIAENNKVPLFLDRSFYEFQKKSLGFTPRKFELNIFPNSYQEAKKADLVYFYNLSLVHKIKRKLHLNYPIIYNSSSLGYDNKIFSLKPPVYLLGYFQSYKYYEGNEELIKKLFSFPVKKLDELNKEILSKIKSHNSIAVHIRRGDYISDKVTNEFHGNCSKKYYIEAIEFLNSKLKNVHLFFFSDDSEWIKKEFTDLPFPKNFIDHNTEDNSWKDMYLMSECKHNIIANSSFSWWSAWLNTNRNKIVIAPKNWLTNQESSQISDLIPQSWKLL